MTTLFYKCTVCNTLKNEPVSITIVGDIRYMSLKCGHTVCEKQLPRPSESYIQASVCSRNNDFLYPFQSKGIEFAFGANLRALIADEMGLGKMVQACGVLKLMKERPAIVICKASGKNQWFRHIYDWTGEIAQVVDASSDPFLTVFPIKILSYDSLRNIDLERIKELKPRLIILDECQQIKNRDAERTQKVCELCADIPHVLGTSGTPIKNNSAEYYTILNVLAPDKFFNQARYERDFVALAWDSQSRKWRKAGLKNDKWFQDLTKDFIIRRTRDEVMPDLPKVTRQFMWMKPDDLIQKAYDKKVAKFKVVYEQLQSSSAIQKFGKLQGEIEELYQLVGLAKAPYAVELTEEFLESTDRKIVLFAHHKNVISILQEQLKAHDPIMFTSDLDANRRSERIDKFRSNGHRVMIASALTGGDTINLQFCSDIMMVERQWNPANEEQVEGRISRIGQEAKQLTAKYLVVSGTIDDLFHRLVNNKREWVNQTLGSSSEITISGGMPVAGGLMTQLIELLAREG